MYSFKRYSSKGLCRNAMKTSCVCISFSFLMLSRTDEAKLATNEPNDWLFPLILLETHNSRSQILKPSKNRLVTMTCTLDYITLGQVSSIMSPRGSSKSTQRMSFRWTLVRRQRSPCWDEMSNGCCNGI